MEKTLTLAIFLLTFLHLHVQTAAECRGSTCSDCLQSGSSCGWCADDSFDESTFSRCQDFKSNTSTGICPKKSLIQPSSSLKIKQAVPHTDEKFVMPQKVALTLRPGLTETVRIEVKVPQNIKGKKVVLKSVALAPKKSNVKVTVDSDCSNKKKFKKAQNKVLCKKLKKGTMINVDVAIHLPSCEEGKSKRKVKLRVVIGKQKQMVNIIVADLCSCKCVKREKAKKCKYNGKAAIGKCTCEATSNSKPDRRVQLAGGSNSSRILGRESSLPDDCPLCAKDCDQHGQCVECLAFYNFPMPHTMCRSFCSQNIPVVSMIQRFEDDSNVCTFQTSDKCIMKFRQIEERIFEVAAEKECPKPAACSDRTDTCMAKSGKICNGYGLCKCGACECFRESMYMGPTCEDCSVGCKGMCSLLKPCVECLAFKDYTAEYKTEKECDTKCSQYKEIMKTVPQIELQSTTKECSFTDSQRCIFNFYYQGDDQLEVKVLDQKVCSDGGWFTRKRRSSKRKQ